MNKQIFVFGSNLAGRHGAGAALYARQNHGAVYGQGIGLQGNSYAIPTKDERIQTLPHERIEVYVRDFIRFACQHPEHTFNVTPIGTGLARIPVDVMKRMFSNAVGMSNINLPKLFGGTTDMKNINEPSPKVFVSNNNQSEMIVGIVGSSKAGEDCVGSLNDYLAKLNSATDTICSGGGKGVDTIVARLAKAKGFNVIEFKPTAYNWEGFKKRNLQIAEKSDRVVSFAYPFKTTKCYHCANAGKDDNHEKTAGCYTGKACGNYEVVLI